MRFTHIYIIRVANIYSFFIATFGCFSHSLGGIDCIVLYVGNSLLTCVFSLSDHYVAPSLFI